jgi:hypothetical protein
VISRRVFGKAASVAVFGKGGMPPRPVNAPDGQQATGGIQPGQSPGIIVARKVIVSGSGGGVFVYDPSIAAGNLIASITDATTSPTGDTTEKGINSYGTVSGITYATGLNQKGSSGFPGLSVIDIANTPFLPAGFFAVSTDGASPTAEAVVDSGSTTNTDPGASITVASQASTAGPIPHGLIVMTAGQVRIGTGNTLIVDDNAGALQLTKPLAAAPAAVAATGLLYANVNATPAAVLPSGFAGTLALTQTETGTRTLGNSTAPANLSFAWVIPAGDLAVGTVYVVEVPLTGVSQLQVLNLGVNLGGFTNVVPVSGGVFAAAGHGIAGTVVLKLTCTATGGAGSVNVDMSGSVQDASVNRTGANSAPVNGHTTIGINTFVANAFAVAADWGALAAGQSLNGVTSTLTRTGP